MILTLLMSNKLQIRFVCDNCCDATFDDALWAGSQGQKQIDNLAIYEENRWNKIVFSNKKCISFLSWHNLKGQHSNVS